MTMKHLKGMYFIKHIDEKTQVPARVVSVEEVRTGSEKQAQVTFEILADDLMRVRHIRFMPLAWIGESVFFKDIAGLDFELFGNTERSDYIKRIEENKAGLARHGLR